MHHKRSQLHCEAETNNKKEGSSTWDKGQETAKHGQVVSTDYFLLDSCNLDLFITF